jgi:hypothetical protein
MARPDCHVGIAGVAGASYRGPSDVTRGTWFLGAAGVRSFSGSTSALLWGSAGGRGEGHNTVLLN